MGKKEKGKKKVFSSFWFSFRVSAFFFFAPERLRSSRISVGSSSFAAGNTLTAPSRSKPARPLHINARARDANEAAKKLSSCQTCLSERQLLSRLNGKKKFSTLDPPLSYSFDDTTQKMNDLKNGQDPIGKNFYCASVFRQTLWDGRVCCFCLVTRRCRLTFLLLDVEKQTNKWFWRERIREHSQEKCVLIRLMGWWIGSDGSVRWMTPESCFLGWAFVF